MEQDTTLDHNHGKLAFDGESDALVKLLQEHVIALHHGEPHVRRGALAGVASLLDLMREVKTREALLGVLKVCLWREDDPCLVQSVVKVLVDVAVVPLASGGQGLGAVNAGAGDGFVSSTSSPMKRRGEGAGAEERERFAVVRSVAQVLHGFLAGKDGVGLGLQSSVRVQVLHSLLKVGEKSEGVVTWESLGLVVRRQLRSSDPRVRAVVLRLLVESVQERRVGEVENVKRRRVGEATGVGEVQGSVDVEMKLVRSDEHETDQQVVGRSSMKVGEMLLVSLVDYMKDPYPSVRETAVRALMKLHGKGYELTSECCKNAAILYRDSFEYVRIAAIEMVGLWVRSQLDVKDHSSLKQRTEAFLQVCTTVTDMNMRVREAAFRVLGEATRIPESVLLQTLTKKVAKAPKEADVSSNASIVAKEGDTGSPKFEEGASLLDASAAGAFVHGLEDEYLEVRCVAIEALAKLACKCERMVFGAANLLLDMLNEEVEVVRMQALSALSQLATSGYLSVHDQHLHLFLSVVEDISPEMRTGGRNLLASSRLPSFSTFHSIVRALLTSLEHHPEDEEGVISTFSVLGQTHPTYTECITQELLQEMQGYLNEEVGLDEPRFAAILSLFLGAGLSNSNIVSLIPARFLSYASFISHKLPDSLPSIKLRPVGLKSVRFSWTNREKLQMNAHVGIGRRVLHISNPAAR
ncbi:hypothetical protein M758_6G013900 [Ceratodon purpureus]|nr:hypothetical protein M758_6G013900 [Ceratodon purpureus]